MHSFIIYISPAGTTRQIAQTIEMACQSLGHTVRSFDLGNKASIPEITKNIRGIEDQLCLFIGSPVYACHAVPPVMEIISCLPERGGSYSIPFVTYGVVTSGIALHEMARELSSKGYFVLGAAKVLAVHSLMWQVKDPIGAGHPDEADKKMVEDLVKKVDKKLRIKPVKELSLSDLDYQPEELRNTMENITIDAAKEMLPARRVNREKCTECGICAEKCPVNAIILNPFPVFGEKCFLCYTCMRTCPENAIEADFSRIEAFLKGKAEEFTEQPPSKVFL